MRVLLMGVMMWGWSVGGVSGQMLALTPQEAAEVLRLSPGLSNFQGLIIVMREAPALVNKATLGPWSFPKERPQLRLEETLMSNPVEGYLPPGDAFGPFPNSYPILATPNGLRQLRQWQATGQYDMWPGPTKAEQDLLDRRPGGAWNGKPANVR